MKPQVKQQPGVEGASTLPSQFMLIGELARRLGAEPATIRFYEQAGLIEAKRIGRIRVYDNKDLERLKKVFFLRSLGVAVARIRAMLSSEDASHLNSQTAYLDLLRQQYAVLQKHKLDVDNNIENLKRLLEDADKK